MHWHAMRTISKSDADAKSDERSISPTERHAQEVIQYEQDAGKFDHELPFGSTVTWYWTQCSCQRGEDHLREVREEGQL